MERTLIKAERRNPCFNGTPIETIPDLLNYLFHAPIEICVLPGGKMPIRKSQDAVGFDGFVRAVVDRELKEPGNPSLRLTKFNFLDRPTDPEVDRHVDTRKIEETGQIGLAYRLEPGETVMVGIGFATSMPPGLKYWVVPRSGLASLKCISIINAPGTIDPDYRGEAGALVENRGKDTFWIGPDLRIIQVTFSWAVIPDITVVSNLDELSPTVRGSGGFGSTGLYG